MKIGIRRITAALLVLALALGLTACSKSGDQKKAYLVFQTSPYYTQEDILTAAVSGQMMDCCTDRKSIWYLSEPGEDAGPVLCRVPLDGTDSELLPEYQPPVVNGTPAAGYWGPILGGDGKLWIWEQFLLPSGDSGYSHLYRMRQLDPDTGKELGLIDVTAVMEEMDSMSLGGLAVDDAGTVFLADKNHVAAVDGQGMVLYTLKANMPRVMTSGGAGGTLVLRPDGTLGALTVKAGDEREVRAIDREARDWAGKSYTMPKDVNQIYRGSGQCAFYYINSGTIYGVIPGEAVPLRLLKLSDAQIDQPSSVRCFVLLEEGQAVILTSVHGPGTGLYDDPIQVTKLLPTDEPPAGMKTRLVYGAIGTDYAVKEKIEKFNRENQDYCIEYRDYSEGMLGWTGDKDTPVYQNALTRLYADIAAGYCPDILDESVQLDTLARQDVLEDLWPWIDGDPDIGRDGLMVHVLECLEVDGKLPRVCGGFEIETAVASAAVAGDRTGWTMEEMLEAFGGEMPEFYFERNDDLSLIYTMFHRFDRKAVLYELVNMNLGRFVNMETGECAFDSDDFKSLLQLAAIGEDVPESVMDLDDFYIQMDLGISGTDSAILSGIEQCRVFPWEGTPLLYARTLSEPKDLVIDDVLFGGRRLLTDYEQRLWDADIIYVYGTFDDGTENVHTRYFTMDNYTSGWSENGFYKIRGARWAPNLAADCQIGAADRNVYASYVGFPSASGAGSSFTICQSMGISASSGAKEGAWAFVRKLLLPDGNATGFLTATGEPFSWDGFPVNRETFDKVMQMGMEYWTDPYTGEFFKDANGDPVEFTPTALGVGKPGDIVLLAYLFAPGEAQLERFWRLYESTEQITGRNDALLDIIMEQADVYFAGDKSLEETVQLVQNRATLYVNENR